MIIYFLAELEGDVVVGLWVSDNGYGQSDDSCRQQYLE